MVRLTRRFANSTRRRANFARDQRCVANLIIEAIRRRRETEHISSESTSANRREHKHCDLDSLVRTCGIDDDLWTRKYRRTRQLV